MRRSCVVGHSGGGSIAHGVADARPDRIARVVYVDAGPLGDGLSINDELPVVDGEIPLPDWSVFDDADLVDLDDALRAEFRARSIPEPKGVAYDPISLGDERRYDVPITIIASEFPSSALVEWIAADSPFTRELAKVKHVDYVDLPTGHWPQFTKPVQLGQAIVAVARLTEGSGHHTSRRIRHSGTRAARLTGIRVSLGGITTAAPGSPRRRP